MPTPSSELTAADVETTLCPKCSSRLVTEYAAVPWCERCEWNLDAFTPESPLGRVDRFVARLDHNLGYKLSTSLYQQLVGKTIQRPGVSPAYFGLLAISAVVLVISVGMAALGVYLVVAWPFLMKAVGLLLIGVAILFRPQVGSVRKLLREVDPLTEAEAPALFGLIRRVAAAVGAPMPHYLAVDADFNAFAGVVGITRRRVMCLGLPYLAIRRPQERVALIGHELGHFVNGDNHRSLAAQPALIAFATAADLIDPAGMLQSLRDAARSSGFLALVIPIALLIAPLMYAVRWLLLLAHLGVNVIGARESQRAEYYADDLAAQAAGSTAATASRDITLNAQGMVTVIGARARSREGAAGWRAGVEEARAGQAERLGRLRQWSLRREASIFASHPPSGLRVRMIQAAPHRDPAVVLTEAESAAIDAELAKYEERYRREIAQSW
ncbi:MAG: M48 family metalloprotease [Hamadaea sp.]|uniref:M48 family metallopeptidase n=1 Tax=Hamadaea sp. TaxID=2024425 RepID=UPI00179C1DB1|nr:M48 family metallopeptidase [Hamadaea sp.]NUR70837.1 M48 family metalloprotease [Hamadaea sp.]NUT19943.1 M48 family metalloprotease [Hamadaea sp.]